MTIVLLLFFASLIGIAFMLYKRVVLIRANADIVIDETPLLPDVKEVRYIIVKNVKGYSLLIISVIIRGYVKSTLFLKNKSSEILNIVMNKLNKHEQITTGEPKEVSGFLRAMSEYKHKIKKLKKQIIEEEKRL